METNYSALRRPRKKLCYIKENKSLSNRWENHFTYEDVDKMFDDIDVCSPEKKPSSVLFQSSGSGTNSSKGSISPVPQENHEAVQFPECQVSLRSQLPTGHDLLPTSTSPVLTLNIDSGFPFEAHGPIKTSSPIEDIRNRKSKGKLDEDSEDDGVNWIVFNGEDKREKEEEDPVLNQRTLSRTRATLEMDDCELESPPSRVALSKASSHKAVVKTPCPKNIKELIHEVRTEPDVVSPKSKRVSTQPPGEPTSCVGNDMIAFLKKLQLGARVSKPSCFQKSPVKAQPPLPPEPEEDFLIVEDAAPLLFSFSRKASKRQTLSKSSSSGKESSTEKGAKVGSVEAPQKQKEAETTAGKLDSQSVNQRAKKKKKKAINPEVVESDNNKGDLLCDQHSPAGDLMEQEKINTKKQRKKVSSDQSEKQEDEPKEENNVELEKKEEPAKKTGTKQPKSAKKNNLKGGKTSLKARRKPADVSEAVKQTDHDDVFREQNEEAADAPELTEFTDKNKRFKPAGKSKLDKKSATSTCSCSEVPQLLTKRKKKQPGDWWVSLPQSSEKTENNQPLKKSKQNSAEPSTAVPPPTIKDWKDSAYSKTKPKEPANLSNDLINEAKGNKSKQTKRRNARKEKIKETTAKIFPAEAKPEEQQIPEQEAESSPLFFSNKVQNLSSGRDVFQRVYHHTSKEKRSATSTPAVSRMCPPKIARRETSPAKRRRKKPPGDWWVVPTQIDDSEVFVPQRTAKEQEKLKKEEEKRPKRKPSGLGAAKNGNVLCRTPGGAPATPVKPPSAPKTIKRSLATFKDIFTSVAETPAAATDRDAHQCEQRNVTSQPSEDAADMGSVTCGRPDAEPHSGPDVDECTQPNQEVPQTKDTLRVLRSGPSSMIELEKFDDDDMILPSSRVQAVLSVSDICAPPLKPLTLHSRDVESLTELFQVLWPTDGGDVISPDQFQWYFYQDCVLGIQVENKSGSFYSGKMLMGSYMKKPLWVDHSATTTFSVMTSSVSVTIDGRMCHYTSGQAFMVECARAYSIQNHNAQPAVLYFNRMLAESSD